MGSPWRRFVVVASCVLGLAACDPLVNVHAIDRVDHGVSGIRVYGHDANGALVDSGTTDGYGRVLLNVDAGGSITARRGGTDDGSWYSVLDVAPGDDILIRYGLGEPPVREIVLTAPPLPPTAVRFLASAPCAEAYGFDVATLRIETDCPERGTVVLTALDANDANVGYLVLADVDLTAPLTASGVWQPPSATFRVTITGFPSTGGSVSVERGALVDGYPVAWTDLGITTTTSTGTATGFHPGIGDSVVYRLRQQSGSFCDHREQTFTRSRAADAEQLTFDLGELMPPIGSMMIAPSQLSWDGGGGGVGLYASVTAEEGAGDVQTGPARTWSVVAPPGTTSIRFPTDVGFVWPAGLGDRITSAYVSETASTYWESYADLRQNHARAPADIAGEFTTRSASRGLEFGYIGCQPQP